MKCFAVKIGDQSYTKNASRIVVNNWNDKGILMVSDVEEAKHYKTKGSANAWIKQTLKRTESNIVSSKANLAERIEKQKNTKYKDWYIDNIKNDIEHYKKVVSRLADARVVELDLEIPNFYDRKAIKFCEWTRKHGGMDLREDTTSKRVCKCCGVKMKNIPYFEFRNSNSFRVCVPCLQMRIETIQNAYDGMTEERREEVTAEIVLGNL